MSRESAVKRLVGRLFLAVMFAVAAWLSWSESRLAARVADMRSQVATLNYSGANTDPVSATLSNYVPGAGTHLADDVSVTRAAVAYWLGRYDEVTGNTKSSSSDADILLIAANASYRDAQRDPGTGMAAVQKLDGVLQAYASALKAAPRSVDAAYNYEYVSRVRDQVAKSQGKSVKPLAPLADAGDLPAGATVHGAPGGPPPDAKMEDLQTIAPMEYGDREAQPQASPGGKRQRKG